MVTASLLTTETWSETEGHVGKKTHEESSNQGNGRSGRDVVPSQLVLAQIVRLVGGTDGVRGRRVADTWSSTIRQDGRVDTDNLRPVSADSTTSSSAVVTHI